MFSPEQIAKLDAPLESKHVKSRTQAGRKLSYLEGWFVIAEANRIFGFDAWNRETIETRVVNEAPRKIGEAKKDGFGVSYIAKVRVRVGEVIREGVGAGHGIDADLGLAHESAIKEAETDATKRALMSFGNSFGLALYDKTQENVVDSKPDAPTLPDRLMKAEAMLDAAASLGPVAFEAAWNKIDVDLCVHLETKAKRTFAQLAKSNPPPAPITITSGKEVAASSWAAPR